jgi:hypothetical protein
MTTAWPYLIAVVPMITRLGRDVIALWRDALRRTGIVRILRASGERTRIIDRSPDGAVLEIEVDRSGRYRTRSHAE